MQDLEPFFLGFKVQAAYLNGLNILKIKTVKK